MGLDLQIFLDAQKMETSEERRKVCRGIGCRTKRRVLALCVSASILNEDIICRHCTRVYKQTLSFNILHGWLKPHILIRPTPPLDRSLNFA